MSSMTRSICRGMIFSKLTKKQRNRYLARVLMGKRPWNKKKEKNNERV